METSEHEDRLIDVLLGEQLGGRRCPDVSMKVLMRAYSMRARLIRYAYYGGSVAAVLLVGLMAYLLMRGSYPAPSVSGDYTLSRPSFQRGATLSTTAGQSAKLVLGGYCDVHVAPASRVGWRGRPKQEELFLHEGSLTCKVDRGVGKFSVASDYGTVSVQGTQFEVTIVESKGNERMLGKRMFVKVLAGAVIASTAWTSVALAQGDATTLPAGGTVTGVVTEKGDAWIRVKTEDGKSERYMAVWREGGLDKEMIAKIGKTPVGSKVTVVWKQEERPRVLSLTVLEAPKEGAAPKEGVAPKEGADAAAARIARQQARVAELTNVLNKAKADLAGLRAKKEAGDEVGADAMAAAEHRVQELTARLQNVKRELEQMRNAGGAGAAAATTAPSAVTVAQAEERVVAAKALVAKAEAQLKEVTAYEKSTDDQVAEAKARLERARGKLREAQTQLEKARAAQK